MKNHGKYGVASVGAGRRVNMLRHVALACGATAIAFALPALAQGTEQGNDESMGTPQTFRDRFMNQVVKGTTVHGRAGIYDFRRWHDTNQPYPGQPETTDDFNTQGTNYGAQIILNTGRIYGFSAGAAFVYESSFYDDNDAGTKLNCNLACGDSVENLTQGYLQYNLQGFQIRGGRQLLNTPFAGADQFTFLPRSFDGVAVTFRPIEAMMPGGMFNGPFSDAGNVGTNGATATQVPAIAPQNYETNQYLPFSFAAPMRDRPEWQLFAAKINRREPRGNADHFVKDNRYLQDVDGFWTAGTSFRNNTESGQVIGQYYHYTFDETENLEYAEAGYMTPSLGGDSGHGGFSPYVRAQYVHAYDVDDSRVEEGIDSDIVGLKFGVATQTLGFSIFGNYSPTHEGSFNDGQLLHPYSDLSGVLYTDTMNDGIQEIGPGYAYGARFDFAPSDNLKMYARYVQYQAEQGHYHDFYFSAGADGVISEDDFTGEEVDNQNSDAIGIGFQYDLGGISPQLAGLKIGDNLGITRFDNAPDFYDNRIRFYYEF